MHLWIRQHSVSGVRSLSGFGFLEALSYLHTYVNLILLQPDQVPHSPQCLRCTVLPESRPPAGATGHDQSVQLLNRAACMGLLCCSSVAPAGCCCRLPEDIPAADGQGTVVADGRVGRARGPETALGARSQRVAESNCEHGRRRGHEPSPAGAPLLVLRRPAAGCGTCADVRSAGFGLEVTLAHPDCYLSI